MEVNYKYASPSMCIQQQGETTLGLSSDLSRDEKVSFLGKLKHPLIFRDAMLMLRKIVISDMSKQQKDRTEFFNWLNSEIDERMAKHETYLQNIRQDLKKDMDILVAELNQNKIEISKLEKTRNDVKKELDVYDVWGDYNKIEREFWQFIHKRDSNLWFVLDPVITVHNDKVTFEAFSVDESTYGCLSIDMEEFHMSKPPKLGTTNIDFSDKLEKEVERFRTYTDVTLSINPDGFTVDSGIIPEHIEKKIDLPDTWIKGFNQVSSASILNGDIIDISCVDMYDICSFLRRHKAHKSPRYMKWILEPNKNIRIVFEPFGSELILKSVYNGQKSREEKIWGRRRWLVIENLIPLAKSFEIKLLGFGMPQFITANLGLIKMTIGFSSWSSNDWVKGTAFNIMNGFIGNGNYEKVYSLLKDKRCLSMEEIYNELSKDKKDITKSGIGMLLKRGEGYFDLVDNKIRFRKLYNIDIPAELYENTYLETQVKNYIHQGMNELAVKMTDKNEFHFINSFKDKNPTIHHTELTIDEDGQISKINCDCQIFKKGNKNISSPCPHVLALYIMCVKFLKLKLEYDKVYKINDIMELLL